MNTPKKLVRALFPNVYKDYEEAHIWLTKHNEIDYFKKYHDVTSDDDVAHFDYLDTVFDITKFRKRNAEIMLKAFVAYFNFENESHEEFDGEFITTQDDGEFFVISLPYSQMRKWQIIAEEFVMWNDNNKNIFSAIIRRTLDMEDYIVDEVLDNADELMFMNVSRKEYNKKVCEIYKDFVKK